MNNYIFNFLFFFLTVVPFVILYLYKKGKGYALYLDDERIPDANFHKENYKQSIRFGNKKAFKVRIVRTSDDAKQCVVRYGMPKFMSLDHDLAIVNGEPDTTMIFLRWLSETHFDLDVPEYLVHSENVEGKKNIISLMNSWVKAKGIPNSSVM